MSAVTRAQAFGSIRASLHAMEPSLKEKRANALWMSTSGDMVQLLTTSPNEDLARILLFIDSLMALLAMPTSRISLCKVLFVKHQSNHQ